MPRVKEDIVHSDSPYECDEHGEQDECWIILGEWFCPECIKEMVRKEIYGGS